MVITFTKDYLKELYQDGKSSDKKHRFQPEIVRKYGSIIRLMQSSKNVQVLARYGGLHYEHLSGNMAGTSSVRINNQYRIEFTETVVDGENIATICNITELSNHYK